MRVAAVFSLLTVSFLLVHCAGNEPKPKQLFTKLSQEVSDITFANNLAFNQEFNIYTYRNFYNGGGVGLADINNDGLIDIYLTANQGPNKLYLNKGNFKFEDITERAGVAGSKAWSTGVALADVNGDGWIDIYVCNSGDVEGDDKENELFINNHDLTFTEMAQAYGIADKGFTTHAVFFDYDRDNDLDLYILNNSYQAIGSFNLQKNERPKRDPLGGDKLMRNDDNYFVDVSEQAGIYGSIIGFGLGATVGDINQDGWPDIYVSNDFFERDYLYINYQNGTFKECLTEQMKSISGASMGADLADINNDNWPDIFVTEMLPQTNNRIKTVTTFENWDRYQYSVSNDYYHQFTRNMLQINNGNDSFSEVGRLSGVEATDWSWGALMFDVDNDGLKDIFVANGIYQDLTNQDYLQYISNEEVVRSIVSNNTVDYKKLVDLIPSNPVPDYLFQNQGDLQFINKSSEWGMGDDNFSNGSAYGDLDNDGDLDLVVNHVNDVAGIYRNESNTLLPFNHYLKFNLQGRGFNTYAVGAKISIRHGNQQYYIEQIPNRGFESSVDPRPNIGLGTIEEVDSVVISWPDGGDTILYSIPTNQTINLQQGKNKRSGRDNVTRSKPGVLEAAKEPPLLYKHVDNEFVDFDRDRLVYHMLSSEGPALASGDVNGDGRDDFFIGGSKGNAGALFIQTPHESFVTSNELLLKKDKISEDRGSIFFDCDNDGDLDLYVCSGSNEFSTSSSALSDRLYINDGRGAFTKSDQLLPTTAFESTSIVKPCDYDSDGDLDLFVGVRSHPFLYGQPMNGYVLNNDGTGRFMADQDRMAPALSKIGMITDATWTDVDGDRDFDLVVVGEYMPVTILTNERGFLTDNTKNAGLDKTNGWWNRIKAADIDNDGDMDLIAANHGLNSRFKASKDQPVTMYVNDFDKNGTPEQIICVFNDGKSYPMVLRHDLISQIPSLKKKYLKYESYNDQIISDIFTETELKDAIQLQAFELGTGILINDGKGKFEYRRLPVEAQLSVQYAVDVFDFDKDGNVDILLGGNLYKVKPEAGRYDASYGVFLKGDGKGNFKTAPFNDSGFFVDGEVRDFCRVKVGDQWVMLVARNNDSLLFYKIK
jgi:hypothetical protein